MTLQKYRWAKTYEAGEHELEVYLTNKNIDAERWDADPGEIFEPHVHPSDKKLWCAEGSIVFEIDGNKKIALQVGDALDLPANTMHSAVAGFMGCVCYEFPKLADNPTLPSLDNSTSV